MVCESVDPFGSVSSSSLLVRHLFEEELDQAIESAQETEESRLVRRLCYIKNLYRGDTRKQAGRRVGISRSTTRRWVLAWNDGGVEGLHHASAAAGRRSSPCVSRTKSVRFSKRASHGLPNRFTRLLKTDTTSRSTRPILAENFEKQV